jgi:beta-glucosidase
MQIKKRELASFDEANSQWLVEDGTYRFLVGASVEDIRCETSARLSAYTEAVSNALAPQQKLNLLRFRE